VCSGFLYGNGEQNDIFYEFFRRAWVSLHPQLAALPVIEGGNNVIPTIHVQDLTECLDRLLLHGENMRNYLIAVDQSSNQSQKMIMQSISEGIGSGATQDVTMSEIINEPWCEFMSIDIRLKTSEIFT